MMTLSWFHDPPRGFGASARIVTGPPAAGTFFRWLSAKNPRNFPSADQKGNEAPSVPSIFLGARSPNDCTQIKSRSLCVRAQNATAVPSAEIAGGPEKSPGNSELICARVGSNHRSVPPAPAGPLPVPPPDILARHYQARSATSAAPKTSEPDPAPKPPPSPLPRSC